VRTWGASSRSRPSSSAFLTARSFSEAGLFSEVGRGIVQDRPQLHRLQIHPRHIRRDLQRTLVAVSALAGVAAGATAWSTKLMLALAHIVAAVIVIPMVTRRLSHMTRRG